MLHPHLAHACATMCLDRCVHNALRCIGCCILCHRNRAARALVALPVQLSRSVQHQQAGALQIHTALCQGRLECALPSERPATQRVQQQRIMRAPLLMPSARLMACPLARTFRAAPRLTCQTLCAATPVWPSAPWLAPTGPPAACSGAAVQGPAGLARSQTHGPRPADEGDAAMPHRVQTWESAMTVWRSGWCSKGR